MNGPGSQPGHGEDMPNPIDVALQTLHNIRARNEAMKRLGEQQLVTEAKYGITSSPLKQAPDAVPQRTTSFGVPIPERPPVRPPTEVEPRFLNPDGTYANE